MVYMDFMDITVCYLRKAFKLNHSLIHSWQLSCCGMCKICDLIWSLFFYVTITFMFTRSGWWAYKTIVKCVPCHSSVCAVITSSQCHPGRDQSRCVPSQWETWLHCNDVSYWHTLFIIHSQFKDLIREFYPCEFLYMPWHVQIIFVIHST